jgi:colanic acid/amylovoran biosynthesis glycosyltransferase
MRIAYLINQYPKISHSFIRREIQALERQGVSVMRIAVRGWNDALVDNDDAQERERTRYVLQGGGLGLIVAFLRLLLVRPVRLFQALTLVVKIARRAERPLPVHLVYLAEACKIFFWLREQKIEHLHAHFGTNPAEVAMLTHVLGGPRWSFTVHGPEEFDKPQFICLAEKVMRSTFVVAVSSYGRSQLYRLVDHAYWPKVHVVHCGLDRKFLDDFPVQPIPTRRFVCVGRLCEQKGQLLLLEAARLLAVKGMDFELVLAGDGEMRTEVDAWIGDHKLQSVVRVTGWISGDQVRSELLAARALILPSFAEGLPMVIMEAMALRRPIISTFIAGIPELVRPGEHGWLVPAGDVEALVEAIRTCIYTSKDVLTVMGDAGRERVLRLHDVDKVAPQLVRLFQKAAHGDGFIANS